jgi:hypothetical protein
LVWVFGGVCLLALALGWLARPEDEYAGLRALHPVEKVVTSLEGTSIRFFYFKVAPSSVKHAVEKFAHGDSNFAVHYEAAPGAVPLRFDPYGPAAVPGATCSVTVFEGPPETWYEKTWRHMKRRLGI